MRVCIMVCLHIKLCMCVCARAHNGVFAYQIVYVCVRVCITACLHIKMCMCACFFVWASTA